MLKLTPSPTAPPAPIKASKPEKKTPDPKESTGSTVSEILAGIRKTKGDKVVVMGNQLTTPKRLPTGIFEFDFYIGGGFPCGRYSILYGTESSCKTNISLRAAAVAQSLPAPVNKVVWVNLEQSFDEVWAGRMGVNTSKLLVVEPSYGEEAVDLVDALVRADDVALVVVDSMAALVANKEIGQSAENYDVGTSALLIKRMVNKLMIAFGESKKRGHEPCVILINQTRYKIGVMFGDPETMPGGEAQKFLSSLRVRLSAKNIIEKASSTYAFKDVHAIVKKAKVPVRAVDFDFKMSMSENTGIPVGDTDSFNMVKGHLQALGLLAKLPQGYIVKVAPKSAVFPTLTAFQDRYTSDTAFRMKVQDLVLQNSKEMMFVAEVQPGPATVLPGEVQPIAGDVK